MAGIVGYLIGAVRLPVPLRWLNTDDLQENVFWANIKEISVLIGGIVAVFTYFRNGRSRKRDIAYKKFDRTIEAETYFHNELSKQIQQLTAQYQNMLVRKQYYEQPNNMIKTSILKDEIGLLASIEGFDTIQLIFDETHRMNNYKTIMNDALQYLSDVDERRDKHATNETLHRSRH
jgi:hypothetical protein